MEQLRPIYEMTRREYVESGAWAANEMKSYPGGVAVYDKPFTGCSALLKHWNWRQVLEYLLYGELLGVTQAEQRGGPRVTLQRAVKHAAERVDALAKGEYATAEQVRQATAQRWAIRGTDLPGSGCFQHYAAVKAAYQAYLHAGGPAVPARVLDEYPYLRVTHTDGVDALNLKGGNVCFRPVGSTHYLQPRW